MVGKIAYDEHWLVRPSVSIVPLGDSIFDFFQSSTRRSRRFRFTPEIAQVILSLDGKDSLRKVSEAYSVKEENVTHLVGLLHEKCIVEPKALRERINASKFYRVLNFLGDYFPAAEVFEAFQRIRDSRVGILGCGAVGSWVAIQLAQSGVAEFVLIDNDIIEESNLNRSLFSRQDIGLPKVHALKAALLEIDSGMSIETISREVGRQEDLGLIFGREKPTLFVNCADSPSVDQTSAWLNRFCMVEEISYVIAGGYNLHLSLIGMTVIPGESSCFECARARLDELEDDSLRGVRRLWRPKRNLGSLSPLVGITSSLTSLEVIRLAVKSERLRPAMLNRRGEFNFLSNEISFVDLPPHPNCECGAHTAQKVPQVETSPVR